MKSDKKITVELIQSLCDTNLLWYFLAGLTGNMVETYEDEEKALKVAKAILPVLPDVQMEDQEREKIKTYLNKSVDGLELDLAHG